MSIEYQSPIGYNVIVLRFLTSVTLGLFSTYPWLHLQVGWD